MSTFLNLKSSKQPIESFQIVTEVLKSIMPNKSIDSAHIRKLFGEQKIEEMFFQSLEFVALCFFNQDTGHSVFSFNEETQQLEYQGDDLESNSSEKAKSISSLMLKSYRKFAKILNYLKDYLTMVQLQSTLDQDSQSQIQSLESILVVSQYDKYANSQILMAQSFNIIRMLILRDDIRINEHKLADVLKHISYQELNRSNKQKLSAILEESRTIQNGSLKILVGQLENIMFTHHQENGAEVKHVDQAVEVLQIDLVQLFNEKLNVKSKLQNGELLSKNLKLQLIERSLQVRQLFGISFETSYYFDKTVFNRRAGNILGLNDKILDKYALLKQKREEFKRRKKKKEAMAQAACEEGEDRPLSFRKIETAMLVPPLKKVPQRGESGMSVDSARHYKTLIDSPRQQQQYDHNAKVMKKEKGGASEQQALVVSTSSAKNEPIEKTPKNVLLDINDLSPRGTRENEDLEKSFSFIGKPNLQQKTGYKQRHESITVTEAVSQAGAALVVPVISAAETTKRKNSVRRHVISLHDVKNFVQTPKTQDISKRDSKPQHRKGQMSMAPGLNHGFGNGSLAFNFANQKLQYLKNPAILPKVPGQWKKPVQFTSKEDALKRLLQLAMTCQLRNAFHLMSKDNDRKNKQLYQPFSLILVKKSGQKLAIQDLQKILEGHSKSVAKQQRVEENNKPFELIQIKDGKIITPQQSKPPSGLVKSHTTKERRNSSAKKQRNDQEKAAAKRQAKKNLMKKFKALTDKIDKVKKEAEQLNLELVSKK